MNTARQPPTPSDREVALQVLREKRDRMRDAGDLAGARVVAECMRCIARRLSQRTDAGRRDD